MVTPAHRAPATSRWRPAPARPGISEAESRAWAAANAALDRVAVDLERTWGVNRLPELVAPDLAAKFATAQEQCDEAIRSGDTAAAAGKATALVRGWKALDAAARAAGHTPGDLGAVWFASVQGRSFAVCLHTADVGALAALHRDHEAVSLEELLRLLDANELGRFVSKANRAFPGIELSAIKSSKPAANWARGDDLPF
jgi:hypothetical protein